jgi:exopolysaccharide biosynthesis polyprenyl glycosylphosphotransferase
MTPELAARLTLHAPEAPLEAEAPSRRVRFATARSAAIGGRELRQGDVEGRASRSLAWREAIHRRLLGAADMVAVAAAVFVVLSESTQRHPGVVAAVGAALALVVFKISGLYDRDDLLLVHSTLDEVPLLVQLTALFAIGMAVLQRLVFGGALAPDQIAILWTLSLVAVVSGRMLARAVAGRTSPWERCLVIGDSERVDRIRQKLASSQARATVVASLPFAIEEVEDIDWIAIPAIVGRIVRELGVHRIIVAPTTSESSDVVDLIRVAQAVGVRVSVLPRMFEVVGSAVEFDDIDGMPMLGVRRFGLSRSSLWLKRTFDIVSASAALLILSPIILAVSLAIRLDSKGPIFFRQVRVGRDGKHFRMFKFRSMVADAEVRKESLRVFNEAGDGLFKITEDPRVTRVGRFLRRASLDELPQLFNVMLGEMSLVGPRPLVLDEDAQVRGLDRSRLQLTPGITGPWQILGSRVPMREMVGIDYLYVANWSLWLDLKVLLRTARHVARGGNV